MRSATQTEKLHAALLSSRGKLYRTRIAPTPSGYLHIGNAFSFILTSLLAKLSGGKTLLRIDDLDHERKRPEYIQDIFHSLGWLGIHWDLGPQGPDDFEKQFSQVHRLSLYAESLNQLRLTDQIFACSCSRSNSEGGQPHRCKCETARIPLESPAHAWRFRIGKTEVVSIDDLEPLRVRLGETTGNFVIRKRDGSPAYQLTSVVDDIHFQINLIVRGSDLLDSSAMQLKLKESLGNKASFKFIHHDLITGANGIKLSKSAGTAIKSIREGGDAAQIFREFSEWLQIPGSPCTSLNDLVERFQ